MNDFNFSEFIAMGGYAKYVWSSWVFTIIAMASLVVSAICKRKILYRQYQQKIQHSTAREQRLAKQKDQI